MFSVEIWLIVFFVLIISVLIFTFLPENIIVSSIKDTTYKLKRKISPKPTCFHSHSYFNNLNDIYIERCYKGIKD